MRTLYDPATIFLAIAGAATLAGGFMDANAAKKNAEGEAEYLRREAEQTQRQKERDLRDLDKEESRLQARARAILAAGGGGTTEGSGAALLQSNAAEYGIKKQRVGDDANTMEQSLLERSDNVLSAGRRKATSSILGGLGGAAKVGSAIFKK